MKTLSDNKKFHFALTSYLETRNIDTFILLNETMLLS
jgi:hypothetical protein